MTEQERVKMALIENDVKHIKTDVKEMKDALLGHIDREMVNGEKYVEKPLFIALENEVSDKLYERFAGKWTEGVVKQMAFGSVITIVTGIVIFAFQYFF